MKIIATTGYLDALKRLGFDPEEFPPASKAIDILLKGCEPPWLVGAPAVPADTILPRDRRRPLMIPSPLKFYAMLEAHAAACDCGCSGEGAVTFLLPDELLAPLNTRPGS